MEINKIHCREALGLLGEMEDGVVHLTFTSPPYYNAREYIQYRDYGAYIQKMAKVFKEVHRVTKEGRFCVINTSPVITAREKRSKQSTRHAIPFDLHYELRQIGWEFIDDIIWVKPEPSVKNRNATFGQHRRPLAYKPNVVTEYIMVYRKKTDRLIDWNMRQYSREITEESLVIGEYPTSNVWQVSPKSDKHHPAVFPQVLCDNIIRFYSYKGDIVFDPFAGSGSVALSSQSLGRKYLGCDIQEKYCQVAMKRLSKPYTLSMFGMI